MLTKFRKAVNLEIRMNVENLTCEMNCRVTTTGESEFGTVEATKEQESSRN